MKKSLENQRMRAKLDLSLQIEKVLFNFKSKEEPNYKVTKKDKISVLAKKLAYYINED